MFCFTKARRLLKRIDFDHVFNQAKKVTVSDFTLLYRNNEVGYSRLGLVIPKKIIAKAHDRNYIKRLIRETFRLRQDLPSCDIIVLVRKGIKSQNKAAMNAQLEEAWKKLAKLNTV